MLSGTPTLSPLTAGATMSATIGADHTKKVVDMLVSKEETHHPPELAPVHNLEFPEDTI